MALGAMISGGIGLYNMFKGANKSSNIANNQPTEDQHRQVFGKTQGLIDRMTNFSQYSGGAMDLANQEGNKGVEDAMMMGMGGSQANAIRNRMKQSGLNKAYQQMTAGLGDAAKMQAGLDKGIFGQMNTQQDYKNQIGQQNANMQMGIGASLLPEGGMRGLLGLGLGSLGIGK
tara:strand:- start:468 stop:986 length:519 start_codon:yes stop_codon:yes gene_type:complete